MELVFLNTWNGQLHDELREYVQKLRQSTDLFCFQEAHTTNQSAYDDLLTEGYDKYYSEKYQPNLEQANVMYVRKGIEVIRSGTLLNEGSDIGFANYVVLKQGDTETSVCNVHGIPHPGNKLDTAERIEQSTTILNHFAQDERVVIGGDFNLLPETESVKLFESHGYRNLIAEYAIQSTRNHISLDAYPDNPQYFADYVFTSPAVEVVDFSVPSDIVSDHQSLRVSIEV